MNVEAICCGYSKCFNHCKQNVEAVHMDGAYKCDKCDFATVKKEELKSHVETDHRDGIINVMSVILQQ